MSRTQIIDLITFITCTGFIGSLLLLLRYRPELIHRGPEHADRVRIARLIDRLERREDIETMLRLGRKLQAIEMFRDRTGSSSPEATEAVATIEREMRAREEVGP